jgi:hypothetical protein
MKIVTGMIISFESNPSASSVSNLDDRRILDRLHTDRTANPQRNRENQFRHELVASASGALIGSAATNWTNFVTLLWVAVGLQSRNLAFSISNCLHPIDHGFSKNPSDFSDQNGLCGFVWCDSGRSRVARL